jgi:hypothetical protein
VRSKEKRNAAAVECASWLRQGPDVTAASGERGDLVVQSVGYEAAVIETAPVAFQ